MSYILDALRKAERERNLGKAPHLQVVMEHGHEESQPRNLARIALVAATVLALVAAIAALLLRGNSSPAPAVVAVAASEVPAESAPAIPNAEAASESADPEITSLDDLAESEPAPIAVPEAAEPEIALETQDLQQTQAAAPPSAASTREAVAAAPQPPAAVQEAPVPAGPGDVPLLRDLPASYRADFPALSIEVHVYDRIHEKRWIMVSSRRYREGEVLSEGPRIASITEDGIVFDYRGQQSLYPIAR